MNWLLQTVKTHMKCDIMRHFIGVYTVCKDKKDLQRKKKNVAYTIYEISVRMIISDSLMVDKHSIHQ